jgi:acyl-CoA synthetase (NDP forming)
VKELLGVSQMFEPRSVAIVGASDRSGNLGGDTVRRLIKFRFPGPVWPVNPNATTVAGLPCYASVAAIPGVPDLVILAIPASGLMETIAECAAAGIRYGVAYAGGLGEAGGEGAELQKSIARLCRDTGFLLCGPNCVGFINATLPVTATFATALYEIDDLRPGSISMVGQSGGICTTTFSLVQQAGFGFRHLISSGNEAVVTFEDYLYTLAMDPETKVIAGYLEGIQDGAKFLQALETARNHDKRVVLIKSGSTSVSARAALAHTGALVGEDSAFDVIFRETGVIRVYSLEELVDVSLTIAGTRHSLPSRAGIGIATFGGGNGVIAADQCAQHGLATPVLSAECVDQLRPLLVSVATAANPLDLTPSTAFRAESFAQLPAALDVVAAQPGIHALLFVVGSLAAKRDEISGLIFDLWSRARKPVFVCWPSPPAGVIQWFADRGIYVFQETDRAIRTIARLQLTTPRPREHAGAEIHSFAWPEHAGPVISEYECHRILRAAGLSVAEGELVHDEGSAVAAAQAMEFPVVLKGISAKVTHRAKAGLIRLDLYTPEAVRDAFCRITGRAREICVVLDGVYVQKMYKEGIELLVTAHRDPYFGVMITCGSGGGLTELIDDVVMERAPVSKSVADRMLDRLRIRKHAGDTAPAAEFIARFSELAATAPWSRFTLELNPVKWTSDRVVAVDGLIIVDSRG